MLAFKDALNNDNPISDEINIDELNTWYFALALIGSNLFGIPLMIYGHKHAIFILTAATFVAVFLSLLYHTCQTTHVCFGMKLSTLTLCDHISAPAFMMMLILFIINLRSVKQIKNDTKQRSRKYNLIEPKNDVLQQSPLPPQENITSTLVYNNNHQQQQQQYMKNNRQISPYNNNIPISSINDVNKQQEWKNNMLDTMNEQYKQQQQQRNLVTFHTNIDRFLKSESKIQLRISEPVINNTITTPTPQTPPYINNNNNDTIITTNIKTFDSWHESRYEQDTDIGEDELEEIEGRKTYYNVGYSMQEPNDISDAWGVYIMYTSLFVVILAALAHPFSFQAFIISIVFGFAAIFFKMVIIDEGLALNMYHRISLHDLLVGIFMIIISLVFYMIDIWYYYGLTHSLWHVFSFLGSYFLVIGLTKSVSNWYSPIDYCYKKTLICCLNQRE